MVAGISALVGLDYLGFGLAPPTPSWGQMLDVGLSNISKWWMVFSPVSAQFFTLLAIVFIGGSKRSIRSESLFKVEMSQEKLIEIKNLKTFFNTEAGIAKAVNDVSFDIYKGEVLGIVGESGSGKSVTSMSINRLIPNPPGEIVGGEIFYKGKDLLKYSYEQMSEIRGKEIS